MNMDFDDFYTIFDLVIEWLSFSINKFDKKVFWEIIETPVNHFNSD